MNLLIDLGNSRLKWASCSQGKILSRADVFSYDADNYADEMKASLLAQWATLEKPDNVCVCSDVASEISDQLVLWINQQWETKVQFVVPKEKACGVVNAYDIPSQLGSDRWAALIAAKNNIKGDVIIVDCGSAITLDAITSQGQHLGGLILPGIHMMHRALTEGTYKIEASDIAKGTGSRLLANNTSDGVSAGINTAISAFINDMVNKIQKKLNTQQTTNVITGGDAGHMLNYLDTNFIHKPQLVLEGLAIILENSQ